MKSVRGLALIALVGALWFEPTPVAAQSITAADAAPFMGSWTLKMSGPDGPFQLGLKISTDGDKVVADLTGDQIAPSKATETLEAPNGLSLKFTLDVGGMVFGSVITLKPEGDVINVTFDIPDAQMTLGGTAAKGT
jgi:hypothetical protein